MDPLSLLFTYDLQHTLLPSSSKISRVRQIIYKTIRREGCGGRGWVARTSYVTMEPCYRLVIAFTLRGVSVTAPWAFNWLLDGNENKVDISMV